MWKLLFLNNLNYLVSLDLFMNIVIFIDFIYNKIHISKFTFFYLNSFIYFKN